MPSIETLGYFDKVSESRLKVDHFWGFVLAARQFMGGQTGMVLDEPKPISSARQEPCPPKGLLSEHPQVGLTLRRRCAIFAVTLNDSDWRIVNGESERVTISEALGMAF